MVYYLTWIFLSLEGKKPLKNHTSAQSMALIDTPNEAKLMDTQLNFLSN